MRNSLRLTLLPILVVLIAASPPELQQWRGQAARVTITRDDWGIAHVRGKTDADAVFGMIYAQAEDDFPRIEANYLTNLGRTAEAEGEKAIWQDLRARLYVSEPELRANYAASPPWLKRLMDSWAAGLNYYLATHPNVRPRVLTRFEPWMALSFTEGSIGGDIERIDLGELQKFYAGKRTLAASLKDVEPRGSNGIAIAPTITAPGTGSLLLINPHTSFFFRSELQVSSDEGLNAYGASTWGQFFIYQGFNERVGWMHTSSGVDNVDEFAEKVERKGKGFCYRYGKDCRSLVERNVTINYRAPNGKLVQRTFTTWRTHHGPIVREANGRWVSFAMMDKPVAALQQSFLRTKTRDLKDFLKVADLKANSSNNTVFADSKGEIAMLMPQFMPRRDNRFDYSKPVDGSDPATDWGPLHPITELPSTVTPPNGWVQNTNNWPYSAAGPNSPKPKPFPAYMDTFGENPRGIHAVQLLVDSKGWTLDRLQGAAFDNQQPFFVTMVPQLVGAWEALPPRDPLKTRLQNPINAIRSWNGRWSVSSVENTLGNFWGDELWKLVSSPDWDDSGTVYEKVGRTTPRQKLEAFDRAVGRLKRDFGWWQVPWGDVNRFQRISPAIDHPFTDAGPSIPVPFSSARWGSLASFGASQKPGTKRWYGTSGNSFVAVVEFGRRVRARAVTAGGQSGNPASKHFNDQAERYASGNLREVYFYPDQLKGHTERTYRPGD
ncbi:penicillin acylase family protein [Sphingomonas daechungensis]|uniref:penicillin acylase family protein n=1 Tax=Sphingomonas daechungensis TaxID=1176646 RepID=UPI00378387B0